MSNEQTLSVPLSAKISPVLRQQLDEATRKFGPTDGALVRMALEAFLPGYLAAQGREENADFLAAVGAAVADNPSLKPKLEKFLKKEIRRPVAA